MYNVYGSQNEFVERVTREFFLRMRSLGQNGPLRRITVSAVARVVLKFVEKEYFSKLSMDIMSYVDCDIQELGVFW